MSKKLVAILASVVISFGAIGGGGYWLGTVAYDEGLKAGITAVIEQCAHEHSTIYNGDTGDVMVCEGGHMTAPQKTPENSLSEPPSPAPGTPEGGSIPPHMEDKTPSTNI